MHTYTHTLRANADEIEHQTDTHEDEVSQALVLEMGVYNQYVKSHNVYGQFTAGDAAEIQQLQAFCACTGQHCDVACSPHIGMIIKVTWK